MLLKKKKLWFLLQMQIMAIMISSILLHNPSNFMVIVLTNLKTSNRIVTLVRFYYFIWTRAYIFCFQSFGLIYDNMFSCSVTNAGKFINNEYCDVYLVTTIDPIPLEAFTLQVWWFMFITEAFILLLLLVKQFL